MKKALILINLLFSLIGLKAQKYQGLDTIKAPGKYDNIYNRPVYADSLVSSFVIFVKSEVKEHKHANHAEHIYVLEGEAEMKVDGKMFTIKKGDLIFVPKNTWHYVKVTSKIPLKVLSIQAPNFDGKDRIFKESK
ncbi:MAG TPA: cupin domain-containing protein [Bacteroidia bacterium]|nr:cupin domain-containing protein [Bacteroidia bacterium]